MWWWCAVHTCAQEVLTSNSQRFHIRSDVFGFGVMLWALTNGTKPWPQLPALDAARKHCGSPPQRLPQPAAPLADDGLWRIMQRCWAHRVTERPSMAGVRDQLAARLGHMSVTSAKSLPPTPAKPTAVGAAEATGRASDVPQHADPRTAQQGPAAEDFKGGSDAGGGDDDDYDDYQVVVAAAVEAAAMTEEAGSAQPQHEEKTSSDEEEEGDDEYDNYQANVATTQHVTSAEVAPSHQQHQKDKKGEESVGDGGQQDGDDDDYSDWQADQAAKSAREVELLQEALAAKDAELATRDAELAMKSTELLAERAAKDAALAAQAAKIARLEALLAAAGIAAPVVPPAPPRQEG